MIDALSARLAVARPSTARSSPSERMDAHDGAGAPPRPDCAAGDPEEWVGLLGRSIADAIVRLHGGRIWVESVPGEVSTFRFVLPSVVPTSEQE